MGGLTEDAQLPIVEGSLIRLQVERLPGDRAPELVRLCGPVPGSGRPTLAAADEVDSSWQASLRRFDIEHTYRFFKQRLGWATPTLLTRPPPTAGPGWSSPPTPSCARLST